MPELRRASTVDGAGDRDGEVDYESTVELHGRKLAAGAFHVDAAESVNRTCYLVAEIRPVAFDATSLGGKKGTDFVVQRVSFYSERAWDLTRMRGDPVVYACIYEYTAATYQEALDEARGAYPQIARELAKFFPLPETGLREDTVATKEFDPATDLGRPETLERAIAERNAWCTTAAQHLRNEEYFRCQRDAFLTAALTDPAVAIVAEQIVGSGWRLLIGEGV